MVTHIAITKSTANLDQISAPYKLHLMIGGKKINTGIWCGMSKEADIGTLKICVFSFQKEM
jgi:hypothetical protein